LDIQPNPNIGFIISKENPLKINELRKLLIFNLEIDFENNSQKVYGEVSYNNLLILKNWNIQNDTYL